MALRRPIIMKKKDPPVPETNCEKDIAKPYTPESLANRWHVSATMVRNMCCSGQIGHFKIGKLYRIPKYEVEAIEQCKKLQSENSEEAFVSRGKRKENEKGISLRHARERKQSPRGVTAI
ncbi:helix-turn-helix domain-containing protein [Shimia thalassica]|uniref:helix-turn-helix domain-containing protein n=1 Tax=Shimia thalassica TaxID=1715693 RepID=UPI00349F0F0D